MATGWRIVPEGRAGSAFDGEGARRFGGRWNSPGVLVVYASQHKSLAALEQLVHYHPQLPNRFKAFRFQVPDSLIQTLPARSLPLDWRQSPPPPSVQSLGDAWAKASRSAVLAVPSILIPEELNYLLNPAHRDFQRIVIERPGDFAFEVRLPV